MCVGWGQQELIWIPVRVFISKKHCFKKCMFLLIHTFTEILISHGTSYSLYQAVCTVNDLETKALYSISKPKRLSNKFTVMLNSRFHRSHPCLFQPAVVFLWLLPSAVVSSGCINKKGTNAANKCTDCTNMSGLPIKRFFHTASCGW